MTPRIKVCGLTRAEDARLAIELGADALGFIFWPKSPRYVAPDVVAGIARDVPAFVSLVGVFVNQPPADVQATAASARLTTIQLHGDERVEDYAGAGRRVIKALAMGPDFSMAVVDELPGDVTVLLDAHDPVKRGGTGRAIDWNAAAPVARRRPLILSGGLNAGNVRAAVDTVKPYAVDVSSGVESAPGIKDHEKLRAFFAAMEM